MFPDFPFDPQLSSFLPHQEVQRYLEDYCQNHNIRPHIRVSPPPDWSDVSPVMIYKYFHFLRQFNTAVEKVTPVKTSDEGEVRTMWEVTASDVSGCQKMEVFDAVFICSG